MKKTPKDVDVYISAAPKDVKSKLKELRMVIKETAPTAMERISYGMPFYDYKGRLAYFGLAKEHIGLYIPPPIIDEHKKELDGYVTTKSSVHLSFYKKLPTNLIKKLVRARIKYNENIQKKGGDL